MVLKHYLIHKHLHLIHVKIDLHWPRRLFNNEYSNSHNPMLICLLFCFIKRPQGAETKNGVRSLTGQLL